MPVKQTIGVGGVLLSSVVFRFSCISDSFANSDGTATDCCVKNVSFLCLSGGIFPGLSPHFAFFLCDGTTPNMREPKT